MKSCLHCGAKLSDRAVVCVKCGYVQQPAESTGLAKPVKPAAAEYSRPVKPAVAEPAGLTKPAKSAAVVETRAPVDKLKTNRSLLKFILLSILTFGIYGIVVMSSVSSDINIIATRHDGKKTMHYCLIYFVFSWLTLGIVPLVWSHRISGRIGRELQRRGMTYRFSSGTFWLWGILGSFIFVGPFIYTHKLLKAMNLLAEDYNDFG